MGLVKRKIPRDTRKFGSDHMIIEEILDQIITHYTPQKVILFGSYAYGQPDEESDIDLLIIKDTDKSPI